MFVENLCSPAVLYLGFALTQIVIDLFRKMYNTAIVKSAVAIVFTTVLNMLCSRGLSVVSWFIVFIPFVTMTLVTGILLYVFGLAPFTGKLSYSQQTPGMAAKPNPAVNRGAGPQMPSKGPPPSTSASAKPAEGASSTPTATSASTSGERALANAGIKSRLSGIVGGIGQGVGEIAGGLGEGIGGAVSGIGQGIGGAVSGIGQGLTGSSGSLSNGAATAVSGISEGVGTAISGVGQGIGSVVGGLGRGLSDMGTGLSIAFT